VPTASRRELIAGGLPDETRASSAGPGVQRCRWTTTDPLSPVNRRISIIVMNRDAEDRFFNNLSEPQDDTPVAEEPKIAVDLPSISAPVAR
jgi:chemotaxis protein MotB